jgi:hypothetical protein
MNHHQNIKNISFGVIINQWIPIKMIEMVIQLIRFEKMKMWRRMVFPLAESQKVSSPISVALSIVFQIVPLLSSGQGLNRLHGSLGCEVPEQQR